MTVFTYGQNSIGPRPATISEDPRIVAYMPLVRRMARKSAYACAWYLDLEDLEAIGMIALWRACETWVEGKGAAFGTWANLCVRHAMQSCRTQIHKQRRIPSQLMNSTAVHDDDGEASSETAEIEAAIPSQEALIEAHRSFAPLYAAIERLAKRKQTVIEQRFWWDRTLQEIGGELDLTKERVRQIEAESLKELRASLPASFAEVWA